MTEFYFSGVTLGYGVTDKTFEMLETTSETEAFIAWLETSNIPRPESATLLPLLKAYTVAQDKSWEEVSSRHMLSFLLGSWEQRVYWWEVFEVIRRLMLSGVLVLFGPGSAIQSAMSILICLASIKAYSLYAPFREDDDDYLQELSQWQLFMVSPGSADRTSVYKSACELAPNVTVLNTSPLPYTLGALLGHPNSSGHLGRLVPDEAVPWLPAHLVRRPRLHQHGVAVRQGVPSLISRRFEQK